MFDRLIVITDPYQHGYSKRNYDAVKMGMVSNRHLISESSPNPHLILT